jgi:hypothetical protein
LVHFTLPLQGSTIRNIAESSSKKQAINHVFSSSDAPQVNILSSTYSVNVGSSVTLQCTISANPVHTTVYWKKIVNGVSTDVDIGSSSNRYGGSTVNSPSLIISNAVTSDEGFYVCYATNSVGTGQSSQTFLDVIGSKFYYKCSKN